ncbi:unnamed protein product [Lactuca saligna]|uniref:Uncharacterized protein n=1 Tax=Lactuca saligna TaxID=75948 RepID=A0AA35V677_LACSI|nr:unnamed protein product [Lactuca saligna]
MLKRVDPTNIVLVTDLQTIDSTIETWILLATEETRSKRTKNTETGSSKKQVKESKSTKIPKKKPITIEEPVTHKLLVADTTLTKLVGPETQQKEIIPSRTGVFRRIKMKSKHNSISPNTNVVRKPQVTHQGILFREIPALVSPSSKKQRAKDMAKHISKKKKKTSTVIISTESTDNEDEWILETPTANLQKDTSTTSQTAVIPPEDSVAKSFS